MGQGGSTPLRNLPRAVEVLGEEQCEVIQARFSELAGSSQVLTEETLRGDALKVPEGCVQSFLRYNAESMGESIVLDSHFSVAINALHGSVDERSRLQAALFYQLGSSEALLQRWHDIVAWNLSSENRGENGTLGPAEIVRIGIMLAETALDYAPLDQGHDRLSYWLSYHAPVMARELLQRLLETFFLGTPQTRLSSVPTLSPTPSRLLDGAATWILNAYCPEQSRGAWMRKYSSREDGCGGALFRGALLSSGASITVIKDTTGTVFGGFCSQGWSLAPTFQSDDECFAFQAAPKLRVFTPTGINKNHLWACFGQATVPNGIVGLPAIWLDTRVLRSSSVSHVFNLWSLGYGWTTQLLWLVRFAWLLLHSPGYM